MLGGRWTLATQSFLGGGLDLRIDALLAPSQGWDESSNYVLICVDLRLQCPISPGPETGLLLAMRLADRQSDRRFRFSVPSAATRRLRRI